MRYRKCPTYRVLGQFDTSNIVAMITCALRHLLLDHILIIRHRCRANNGLDDEDNLISVILRSPYSLDCVIPCQYYIEP